MTPLLVAEDGPPIVVMVTGSRDWDDVQRIWEDLDTVHATGRLKYVLEGVCPYGGADKIAADWCEMIAGASEYDNNLRPVTHEPHPPASLRAEDLLARNIQMVERCVELEAQGLKAVVLAYPLPQSRGTWHAITHAKKAGLLVKNRGEK